jgi:magnesium-transporting ATPase (P-type)
MALQGKEQLIQKPLSRGMWWACFVMASYIMSLCFQTFKAFTLVPNWSNGLVWLVAMLLLAQVILVLVYDSYVLEKAQGRVQKPVRFFEWMLHKRFLLRAVLEQKEDIQ